MKKLACLLAIGAVFYYVADELPASVRNQDPLVSETDHDLDEGASVSIQSVIGTIRMETGDVPRAHLKTVKRGRDADLVSFQVESDRTALRVETRFPHQTTDLSIEIELTLPRKPFGRIAVSSVSGSIDLRNLEARTAKLSSTSGKVRVNGLKGNLDLSSVSGSVDLAGLAGTKAEITITSGSLKGSAELKELQIRSVSGGVTFDLVPPQEGGWSAKASLVSGNVTLRLPVAAGGTLELSTLSGRLSSGLALRPADGEGRKRSLRGSFGEGPGLVRLSTVAGNIRVDPLN